VDAFFAPVATRIATYSLAMPDAHLAYVADHLADGVFRQWRARGLAEPHRQSHYDMDLPTAPWPGPTPSPAQAVGAERLNDSTNQHCPFSGDPIAPDSLAKFGAQVIGFCNPFCRDKAVADADAWPEVMALLRA
ncbi:MAG: glutathione S-transferase, partial [Pseudomonadota bacterium]